MGGAFSRATGGGFKEGFLGSFTTKFANMTIFPDADRYASTVDRVKGAFRSAIAGGAGAVAGGGKFANGAQTAAFSYLFNDSAHRFLNSRSQCPGECTLVTNPNGTKMFVPSGIAGQVVSANAKGLTLAQEQATPSASEAGIALTVASVPGVVRSTTAALFGESAGFLRTACVALSICSPNRIDLTGQLIRDRAIVREAGRRATLQESRDQIVK